MKGALGNAFIMNMVITFIIIFYMLLIGSMAYSKAYRTKNYMVELLESVEEKHNPDHEVGPRKKNEVVTNFESQANEFLGKVGYSLSNASKTCPNLVADGYVVIRDTKVGSYDYCLYRNHDGLDNETVYSDGSYNYMVTVYMKFDFPVLGQFFKLPIRGETRTYWRSK